MLSDLLLLSRSFLYAKVENILLIRCPVNVESVLSEVFYSYTVGESLHVVVK